jgi:hypothetical protein
MLSGAMGLPVSGFPNMNAVSLEDPTGLNYVNTADFLKVRVCLAGSSSLQQLHICMSDSMQRSRLVTVAAISPALL